MSLETEFAFKSENLPCVVIKHPWGHRLGYVGVPFGHPAYGKSYWDMDIPCHGGLTYSDFRFENDPNWYFGFDCNHLGDESPGTPPEFKAFNDILDSLVGKFLTGKVPKHAPVERDLAYVIDNCEQIARALSLDTIVPGDVENIVELEA